MRLTRSKALLLLLAVCLSSMNACSLNGFQKALQKESESVDADENKQKAEAPLADTRQLDSPQRDQISMGKYAYEHLDGQGKIIYDEMLTAILNHKDKIKLSTTDLDLMRRAYAAVCGDYGGLFWVEGYVFTRYTKGDELVSLEFALQLQLLHNLSHRIGKQPLSGKTPVPAPAYS